MCVCMDAEANNDNRVFTGKETIIVYTRKNRKAKLLDSSDEPSISVVSANGEPSPSSTPPKNHFFKDDDVTHQARVDELAGQDRSFSEQQPLAVVSKGESSSLDNSKEHNEGGSGEEAVADDPAEGLSSGVKEVEGRTQISCGNEDGLQIHASCEPETCNAPVLNGDQEAEPQLDISSMQEPSAGKVLKDGPLELQPNGEGEPMLDCRVELLSNDGQEMNSSHVNETSSDQALESSRGEEFQPSSCKAYAPNSSEDPRQLPDNRLEPPPSGGKVKLPSSAPGPHSRGLDRHENHRDLDIPEPVLSKPLISMNEEKVCIALNESSLKDEILSLKRKLETELDQVRRVARKIDEKERQVAAYNERNMTNPAGFTGSDVSDFSVYNQPHLMRVRSSMDSGHLETRSLGHMSVPVMENSHEVVAYVEKEKRTPTVFAQPHSTMTSSVRSVGHLETRPFRPFSVSLTENNHEDGEFVDRDKRTPKANPYYMNSDFYLEKDRLPPENHNKMPKAPGAVKKHRFGGEYGVAFGFGGDKDGNKLYKDCSNLLQRLMKHKNGWVFNNPVDPFLLGIPDYLDIIKHPMDLGTIKTRLAKKQYNSAMEFTEDIRLVFSNAMTYNPKGHEVHTWAEELLKIFEDRWASIENGYLRKKKYFPARRHDYPPPPLLASPAPSPAPAPAPAPAHAHAHAHAQITPPMRTLDRSDSITVPVNPMVRPANYNIPRVRRTPAPAKPKANDPNKRDMTFDEKQKLSTNLQSLPTERLDAIVQIIKKRSTALSQNDDEIEVDIDGVDAETLWELDRYVSNYKKSLSKYRRRDELAAQRAQATAAAAAAHAQAHETNQVPAALVSQKESIIGGGNTNSAPIQVENHANGNASSSSSSSSSDSGSSSSDSDSDTSSADELDVGHSPGA